VRRSTPLPAVDPGSAGVRCPGGSERWCVRPRTRDAFRVPSGGHGASSSVSRPRKDVAPGSPRGPQAARRIIFLISAKLLVGVISWIKGDNHGRDRCRFNRVLPGSLLARHARGGRLAAHHHCPRSQHLQGRRRPEQPSVFRFAFV
jgi:hypothetical protein